MSETQAIQIVKAGAVSDLEIAYQCARRQVQEAAEQMKKSADAINAVKPQLLMEWP